MKNHTLSNNSLNGNEMNTNELIKNYNNVMQNLKNTQEPMMQKRLTKEVRKAYKTAEKELLTSPLPVLPIEMWDEIEDDKDYIMIHKKQSDTIIGIPVYNGINASTAEVKTVRELLNTPGYEKESEHYLTPASIFYDADVELRDLNGNIIPKGTENVLCPAGSPKMVAEIKALHLNNVEARIKGEASQILKNVQLKTFENIRQYGEYVTVNNLPNRKLRIREKCGLAELIQPTELLKEANTTAMENNIPVKTALLIFNNGIPVTAKEISNLLRGKGSISCNQEAVTLGKRFLETMREKFGKDAGKFITTGIKFSANTPVYSKEQVGLRKTVEIFEDLTPDEITNILQQQTGKAETLFATLYEKIMSESGQKAA